MYIIYNISDLLIYLFFNIEGDILRLELMLGVVYFRAKKKFSFVSIIGYYMRAWYIGRRYGNDYSTFCYEWFSGRYKDKILGMRAHINISAYSDQPLRDYEYVVDNIMA